MTNKERVFRAFNNEAVDRVPVGFWFHHLAEKEFDGGLENPGLAQKNIAGHNAFIDAFHPDFVKIMSDGYFHYPAGKGETYHTVNDLEKIFVLDQNHPWITAQVEIVKSVVALQKDSAYFYNIFSPVGNLQWIIGEDAFYRFFEEDPGLVSGALDTISRGLAVLAEQVIQAGGADGVYFSVSSPNTEKISDDQYRQYITPSEQYFLNAVEKISNNNILHICGYEGKRNHLDTYQDYKAKAINWAVNVEGVSLVEGKKLFGGRAVIGGFANSPGALIHTGSKEDIEAFTYKLLEEAGGTGVIIGADCTVPSDIDIERLGWVRKAASAS